MNRSHPRSESEAGRNTRWGQKGYDRGAHPTGMELCEWTAAAVTPGDGPPEADGWQSIEDPVSPEGFAGERAVAYRTRFADPRDGGDGRVLLTLRGLYAHARIWLNGAFVGSHDTYFTPFRTVFDPQDENELLVECRAPEDRFGGVFETGLIPESRSVPGIRWSARVEGVPETVITDLTIGTDESGDEAGVNAIVTIDAGTDIDGRVRLSLGPAGSAGASALSQVGVSAAAGERVTVQGRLSVRDPERWWPRGFGPQNRYVVRAALGEHERTATTGFRTVEYNAEGLSVNGTRVPVRGLVVLPDERETDPDPIERAVEANATLVRPYGHVPPKSCYEAAGAAGVLLMQDVPMSPGALDAERARLVARTLAGAVGRRPSLAAFGVHDDSHGFDVTTDEDEWRVLRSTGNGGGATATAAAAALPGDVPTISTPGLDGDTVEVGTAWVLDGCSANGARTRYVVPGTDDAATARAERAIEALRLSNESIVTAFGPPGAVGDAVETAFAPVGIFLDDPTAAEPRVVVVNDTPEPVAGDLDWTTSTESATLSVAVDPLSRTVVDGIDWPGDAERIELILSTDERRATNEYER